MSVYGQSKPTDWDTGNTGQPVAAPAGWKMSNTPMICPNPNCGYQGAAAVKAKGSRVALWLLLCTFVVPGLIYAMFFAGTMHCCPKCRTMVHLA